MKGCSVAVLWGMTSGRRFFVSLSFRGQRREEERTKKVGCFSIGNDIICTLSVSDMRPKTRADDEVSSPIRSAVIPKLYHNGILKHFHDNKIINMLEI